jgi:hypothetical protein
MENISAYYSKSPRRRRRYLFWSFSIMTVLCSLLTVGIYNLFPTEFYPSYLVAYVFWISIMLGALFLTLLHHVSNAIWSTVLRRITESLAMTVPVMLVLFIPVWFGIQNLYHWSDAEAVAADHLLQAKSAYLNVPFFIIRSVLYFVVWMVLALILYRTSLKQDQNYTPAQARIFRTVSAPGIILFAITITFAAFDWLMSLDPHWYSTIFGLYIFAGSFLSALAFITLTGLFLRRKNLLRDVITLEHYHDLAKLMFSFTIFWGYMAFSQYFLIWYANIPEETIFFRHRWEGSWKYISLLLVFGQFLIPFLGLMTRAAKRNTVFLAFISVWILLMHFFDLYWIVMPNFKVYEFYLSAIDLIIFLAIGGIFVSAFLYIYLKKALIPLNDPKLDTSINLANR